MKGFFDKLFGGDPTPGNNPEPLRRVVSPIPEQSRPTPFNVGDAIRDRWDIHRVMQGGMGIVYVVYDRKWREVFAAKTFQQSVFTAGPVIKARFENEATAWVNLDLHPNITEARFLDVINGQPFLFLEYVAGGDLSRWIGTPRLLDDLPQVLRFGVQFCDGMRHVTSKGIKAHRDIKPQNCLVTQDGILKITDFGLAKVWDHAGDIIAKLGAAGNVNHGMSQTGSAAGTCTHMAPEQVRDSKHVDVRADIYSLGVILFQMVCGELPFIGRTFEEFGMLHTRTSPPIQKIADQRIRKVIERCLRKNPEDRYPTFDDLRGRLKSK
jgi:serine/threonine protein kinase